MLASPLIRRAGLAVVVLLATQWLGWPAPAVVGAGVAALAAAARAGWPPRASAPAEATFATLLGWGVLLAWSALGGRAAGVTAMLGGLAGMRGAAGTLMTVLLALLTLALGAALAWGGATVVAGLLGRVTLSAPATSGLPERPPAAQTP